MTPPQFRDTLTALQVTTGTVALWVTADARLVRRWYSGARPVPDDVGAWLEGVAGWFAAHPPPVTRGRDRAE